MSTSRLADQRIRASASQVVGLDVRGPVSQALGQIPVPLADEVGEAKTTETTPTRAASRPKVPIARRVVKPFADAPWPTRQPKSEPKAVLSGLTADERRVHRILLDTLAMQNDQGYGQGVVGLSYAEKQRLAVLDLAYIDAEIAKMDRGTDWNTPAVRWITGLGGGALGLIAAGFALGGEGDVALAFGLVAFLYTMIFGLFATVGGPSLSPVNTTRRKIYDALRELALLADPNDVTSDALAQADAVIDRLAGAPGVAASDHAPRLSLDSETLAPTASASRTRTRS